MRLQLVHMRQNAIHAVRTLCAEVTLRRVAVAAFFIAQIIALTFYCYVMSFPTSRSSDDANNFLAGIDMGAGNWNLHGWSLAPDNLFSTDILGMAIASRLFGPDPAIMRLWQAFLWALITVVAIRLAGKGKSKLVAAYLLLVLLMPFEHGGLLTFTAIISSHASTILLGLLTFWLADKIVAGSGRLLSLRSTALVVTVLAGSLADPIYVVIACLPVVLTCFTQGVGPWHGRIAAIGYIAIGIVLSRCSLALISYTGGFQLSSLDIEFAKFSDIPAHVEFAANAIATLMGADFFGKPVTASYIHVLRFPFFLILLFAMVEIGLKFVSSLRTWPASIDEEPRFGFLDKVLFASVLLSCSAVIVTTTITDWTHTRHFLPSIVMGAILLVRCYARFPLFSWYATLAAAGSLVAAVHAIQSGPKEPLEANQDILALAETLKSQNLRHGYADYWKSSIVSALTRQEVQVLAVNQGSNELAPMLWFANVDWYKKAASNWREKIFVVTKQTPTAPLELSQDFVIKQWGTPSQIVPSGSFLIDIYDREQVPYLPLPPTAETPPTPRL